jgi:hypothetical protein
MTPEEMLKEITDLKKKVQRLEDIEAIKYLQRAYGYYLQHYMAEDLTDLFADHEETELKIAAGTFKGKEAVARLFHQGQSGQIDRFQHPKFLHQVMQLSGVIDVDPDGQRAKGRWYGFGANAFPTRDDDKVNPGWMNGIYEVEYIKQDGVWKLLKVRWMMIFHAPWAISFVPAEERQDMFMNRPYNPNNANKPTDVPEETQWPSGFIAPFHFTNPVSGRKTDVTCKWEGGSKVF